MEELNLFFFEKKSSTFGVKKNRILSGNDRLEGTDLLVWLVVADVFLAASHQIPPRVKKTGRNRSGYRGYRSNRPGPVPVPAGFKPV